MQINKREEIVNFYNGKEQLVLLHISDVHLGWSTRILEILFDQISQIRPDLILFTGDYCDFPSRYKAFYEFLYRLFEYGILLVYGNHDLFWGNNILNKIDTLPHCNVLENKMFQYRSGNGFYYHFASWEDRDKLPIAENNKNIILIHNPEIIQEEALENIDLVLAGHLHGGQIILFQNSNGSFFPGNLYYKFCIDRKRLNGSDIIISKGVADTFPVRFGCPKEIVKIYVI